MTVETGGALKLQGRSAVHALAPGLVARNTILSNVAEAGSEGDVIPLPISREMADAWLAAIAATTEGSLLRGFALSSRQLVSALMVRDARPYDRT